MSKTYKNASASFFLAITLCTTLAFGADIAKEILDQTSVTGGLVVHLDCDDGVVTESLLVNERYLVHGLDTSAAEVAAARNRLRNKGRYGKISIALFDGKKLPYADNLVNLLVADKGTRVTEKEISRILAPRGEAYIKEDSKWRKVVKALPKGTDDWTHYLHDAGNNAVANDRVSGPPRHLQWMATPVWTRHHDKQASMSALVTSKGRIFYILDRGPVHTPNYEPDWFLEARDAFNGILLWKQPMKSWVSHTRGFRSGPVQLARLLVTDGDRVFTTLGIGEPVSILDADTGKELKTATDTKNAEELIVHENVLLVVAGATTPEHGYVPKADISKKRVMAVNASTGKLLWTWPREETANIVPQTLAANGKRVFFQDGNSTVSLDIESGAQKWRDESFGGAAAAPKKAAGKKRKKRSSARRSAGWGFATLVVHDGVVLSCDGRTMRALSAANGKELWESGAATPFGRTPSVDILVINGVVWSSPILNEGRDLHTGKIVKKLDLKETLVTAGHHHRCYRNKGVGDHIVFGHRGMEYFDTEGENHVRNNWVRGLCQYGIMPANGLTYVPPHNCGCYPESILHGFWTLAHERNYGAVDGFSGVLEKGPAYDRDTGSGPEKSNDWPTYRGDASRSGSSESEISRDLTASWRADIGGSLTAPVVANGTVILARKDNHTVYALDGKSGKVKWSFTAGGGVDSAPTIHRGRVLFGAANGYVYCLALDDGSLMWRFRAAPAEINTVVMGQVESLWPVHGSILIKNDTAYFAAGRSSYLDGGILIFGLDPATGKVRKGGSVKGEYPGRMEKSPEHSPKGITQNRTDYKTFLAPDKSDAFSMEGNVTDIMVADESSVYLRHMRFSDNLARQPQDVHHLFSTSTLLDDQEAHRSHWFYGNGDFSRLPVAYEWITRGKYGGYSTPFGKLLVFDGKTVWGIDGHGTQATLFASDLRNIDERIKKDFPAPSGTSGKPHRLWQQPLALHARTMTKAGDVIAIAGVERTEQLLANGKGGKLLLLSTANGEKLSEIDLDIVPVFDGMAAAGGQLFVSFTDGTVACMK
ncbi:MAG: PQQ-binding-like beta-propeller repeat protein [Kiritimatiellia bacterium]|jgi:outer membrane protein assembly factor BamB|nr:PQQ-binding-like beta-propeller repeat protein [Kiritimatiellia bacterium]